MKLTTFAQSTQDLDLIKSLGLGEVILGESDFSRFSKLSSVEYLKLAHHARSLGLRVIFEWDILMTQTIFESLSVKILSFSSTFDSLRVQDPGAFEWALEETTFPLQLIVENGNHNLLGLQSWVSHSQGRLERLILSIELPRASLELYLKNLSVPCELLGLGRILLFYTPRKLLAPLVEEKKRLHESIEVIAESEESPHKGFPVLENRHGTFMFHLKNFSLLDYVEDLKRFSLSFLRVDLRWNDFTQLGLLQEIVNREGEHEKKWELFKTNYPQDLMRGFYLVNKTDILFPKLKNHRLQDRQGDYVGEVIEADKTSHLALMVKSKKGLKKGDSLRLLHPKGEVMAAKIHSLKDLSLTEVDSIGEGKVALIPYIVGVWVKSQVYYTH